ncbi:MAG: hypothetical protein QOE70_6158 [Chthoniobacter sp.]|nr:hypothetical protein [Chthoniobacter sp.]
MWTVCFGNVLTARGLGRYIPYAYAVASLSAFISPMVVGALADQRIAPMRLLRWLAAGAAAWLALAFWAIERGWHPLWMLLFLQFHSLCSSPVSGLATGIVLGRLRDPAREFGPIRAWMTAGWVAAGWTVSWILSADASTRAGFAAALCWAIVAVYSLALPQTPPVELKTVRSWRDVFGWQAMELFANRDHRAVLLTAALLTAALAAFYPYTPIHLRAVGVEHATAAMTLGQATEVMAMFGLAGLLARVRLKTIFLAGIGFGVLRYVLFAFGSRSLMLVGVTLHGLAFTLYFITAQIYIEQRVDARLRSRAQSLLVLMMSGFGNLTGFLGSGWWREWCLQDGLTRWPVFWGGLAGVTALVFIFFANRYAGQPAVSERS